MHDKRFGRFQCVGGWQIRAFMGVVACAFYVIYSHTRLPAFRGYGAAYDLDPNYAKPVTEDAIITFIIPSTGRTSLVKTLRSLQAQTSSNWKAVVMFDGIERHHAHVFHLPRNILLPDKIMQDMRFSFYNLPTTHGSTNCGAQVRNAGLAFVDTPWVGFVDDDDTLASDYVSLVEKEQHGFDVLIFRMYNAWLRNPVLPPLNATDIELNGVGISFAMRANYSDIDRRFRPSSGEDFELLHRICHFKLRCTILPYLTYFVKDQHANVSLQDASRSIIPQGRALTVREIAELRLARTLCVEAKRQNVSHTTYNPFILTEHDHLFFGVNSRALEHALQVAIDQGCFPANTTDAIHVMFSSKTVPVSKYYVQVQLEQHSSTFLEARYLHKLKNALQVWEMSTKAVRELATKIPDVASKTFAVPTTVYHDSKSPPIRCDGQEQRPSGSLHVYHRGCYFHWYVSGPLETFMNVRPGKCGRASCRTHLNPYPPDAADVLIYGALNCSHFDARENVCDELHRKGLHVACIHGVYGQLLSHYACRARVVVMERFYSNASLETHRLDALLLAGKIVVSTRSSNAELDKAYEDYVIFVERHQLADKVKEVLANWSLFEKSAERHRLTFVRWVEDTAPLCYALRSLSSNLRQ